MKRIITCSDGTWNKHGSTDKGVPVETNVEKMFNCICSPGKDAQGNSVQQCKVYDQGVGTGYTWKDKIVGGATGAGIDKNIKDMYSFIVLNYEPGDEIYLFGFSRGAYTARSIGGFVRNCGILKPDFFHLIDKAYDLYRDRNDYTTPDSDLMIAFRKNYCFENITRIKFIGVWDTVGSLGIPLPWYKIKNKNKYKFHDVTLSSTVDNAYHALATDERRKLFMPTLWEKSNRVKKDKDPIQKMEQRWFAGVHSNVGGGYADCSLSNIALMWLIEKAKEVGLCFDDKCLLEIKPNYMGELRNSYDWKYWFWLPVWRKVSLDENGQVIDDTVWEKYRANAKYRPGNLKQYSIKNQQAK